MSRIMLRGQGAVSAPYFPSFGININAHSGSAVPRNFADATNAGIFHARHTFKWSEIEQTQGNFTWTNHDPVVNEARGLNVKLVGVLNSRPSWTGAGDATSPPPTPSQYYTFVDTVVRRYVGKIECWQVWNEPDLAGWTTAEYKTILLGAYPVIKAADPAALVGGIVLSKCPKNSSGGGPAFGSTLISDSAVQANMDILPFHTYCRPESPETGNATNGTIDGAMRNTKIWLQSVGWTKPVWITEGGWPTIDTGSGQAVSEANQARYIVRMAIMHRALGADRFYPYRMYSQNLPPFTENLDSEGILRGDGSHKPSYEAMTVLNRVARFDVAAWHEVAHNPVWCYRMERAGGRLDYVLWTNVGNSDFTLTGLTPTVRQTSILGSQTTALTNSGQLTITAGIDPIYVETL